MGVSYDGQYFSFSDASPTRKTLPWDELFKLRLMLTTQVLKLPLGGLFGYNIGSGGGYGGYGGFGHGGFGGLGGGPTGGWPSGGDPIPVLVAGWHFQV
jgi:hypothetical protein